MYTGTPVENKTYLFGQDLDKMNQSALLANLRRAKDEKSELVETNEGIGSTFITNQVAKLEAAINVLKAKLDAGVVSEPPPVPAEE